MSGKSESKNRRVFHHMQGMTFTFLKKHAGYGYVPQVNEKLEKQNMPLSFKNKTGSSIKMNMV